MTKKVRRITWIGLLINLLLAAAKFVAGTIGNSQAVIADAIHSLTDIVTDIAVLVGANYWSAPPDLDHPYGHHRIETFVTIFIGIILFITAFSLASNATTSLINGEFTHIKLPLPLAVTGFAVLSKEILYRITKKMAKELKSSALLANAKHHRSDVFSSLPVLVTIIVTTFYPSLAYLDKVGAIVVSIFIAKASWEICAPAIAEIMEVSAPEHIRERIKEIVLSNPQVKSTHAIRTRRFGPYYYVDLHIQIDPNLTVHQGHKISGEVKAELLKDDCGVSDVIVHIEPAE